MRSMSGRAIVCLLWAGMILPAGERLIPLTTMDGLEAVNAGAEVAPFLGRSAVRLRPVNRDQAALAILPVPFAHGSIEFDLGFGNGPAGLALHVSEKGRRHEAIYLRATGETSSAHYLASPEQRAPRSEAPVEIKSGAWNRIRIEVSLERLQLFVNGSEKAALSVDAPIRDRKGSLALWVGPSGEGYFSNLKVRQREAADWTQAVEVAAKALDFHGAVLIQSGNDIVVQRAFGKTAEESNPATRYWVASVSKSFTSTIIFKLEERGTLSRNDELSRFFPDTPADKRHITIDQLLTHRSGLPNEYLTEGVVDREEAVKKLLATPLKNAPGAAFGYTNDGYSLLAAIAEVAAKTPYFQLIDREIFDPAGMRNSGFWPKCPGPVPALPLSVPLGAEMTRENWGYKGPDGICSNVLDLLRFMNALRAGKILKATALDAMWAGQILVSGGDEAGAGWFRSKTIAGTPNVWTRGTDHGHNAMVKFYPALDVTIVSLSSSKDPDGPLLARQLVTKIEDLLRL